MPDSVVPEPILGAYDQPLYVNPREQDQNFLWPDSDDSIKTPQDGGKYIERVGGRSPWVNSHTTKGGQLFLPFRIPAEHMTSCFARWLGYAKVEGTQLKRVLPVTHPIWRHMRCRALANVQGISFTGRSPQSPKYEGVLGPDFPTMKYAQYDQIHGMMVFEPLPWVFKTDEQITYEYERYLWVRPEPGYESLYITGGSKDANNYLFDSTSGGGAANKVSFPAGRNIPLAVATIRATWFDVPIDFIDNQAQQGFYQNLYDGIGCLNDASFLGFPAYSLYADPPQVTPQASAIYSAVDSEQQLLADVEFTWHYFYPTPLGTGVSTNLGHNMAIYRQDRKWYPASINGDGVTRLYPTYDFKKFFQRPV